MTESLRKHQLVMLELLNEVDRVCKKHHISYQLFAGTALGAVRHQGFIPWDDDLDIVMQRPDYEHFMAFAPGELGERFFLQKEFTEHWPMFFSKLRLNHTTALEKYHVRDEKMHQGVYIDIFPCDNLSDNQLVRKLQFFASKIIIAKGLYGRGYETDSRGKNFLCRSADCFRENRFTSFVFCGEMKILNGYIRFLELLQDMKMEYIPESGLQKQNRQYSRRANILFLLMLRKCWKSYMVII